jgi:glycosyltransferase involved in cell wall biosynthesis
MTILSLVMPFYLNRSMLELQMREWRQWSPNAKAQIEIIIVDDGSPDPALDAALPGLRECDRPAISIYRITEDRPWHQHAARNLGAHVAQGPWLLLTDMDHVLTAHHASILASPISCIGSRPARACRRWAATIGLNLIRIPL